MAILEFVEGVGGSIETCDVAQGAEAFVIEALLFKFAQCFLFRFSFQLLLLDALGIQDGKLFISGYFLNRSRPSDLP